MQNQETQNTVLESKELSNLAAFGLRVESTMTTPTRPGKKPRPVWVVAGNIFGLEEFFRDIKGRKFRGSWSFFVDPSGEILEFLQNGKRLSYAEQIESKRERKLKKAIRYENYAANAEARAEGSYERATSISSMIPMGQPILIGHHSEARHRRDLKRIDSSMRKSVEESLKAEYFADKAASLSREEMKLENRQFVGNRIKEAKASIAKLLTWLPANNARILQVKEKLNYWENRLAQLEEKMQANGSVVPSSSTVKIGDLVNYGEWYPVIRVNRNTVTVSHWLGIEKFSYKIPYSRIKAVKQKPVTI